MTSSTNNRPMVATMRPAIRTACPSSINTALKICTRNPLRRHSSGKPRRSSSQFSSSLLSNRSQRSLSLPPRRSRLSSSRRLGLRRRRSLPRRSRLRRVLRRRDRRTLPLLEAVLRPASSWKHLRVKRRHLFEPRLLARPLRARPPCSSTGREALRVRLSRRSLLRRRVSSS